MKKLVFCLCVFLLLSGCARPMSMDTVGKEPNFAGVVEEAREGSILVRVNEDEEGCRTSDLVSVSLDAALGDSMTHFSVGDAVRVYYDGTIAESYPAQVDTVYAIILVKPPEDGQAR